MYLLKLTNRAQIQRKLSSFKPQYLNLVIGQKNNIFLRHLFARKRYGRATFNVNFLLPFANVKCSCNKNVVPTMFHENF